MANKQKLSELVINNVLAFIRPFASKTLQRAIEILLKPCCDVSIINAEVVCLPLEPIGTYEVTLTLSKPLGLLGNGLIFPLIGGFAAADGGLIPYAEGTIIKFTTKDIPEIVGNSQSISAFAFLPSGLNLVISEEDLTPFVGQILLGIATENVFFEDCWT